MIKNVEHVGFEVLTAVKNFISWDITPFQPVENKPTFRGNMSSPSRSQGEADNKQSSACCLLHAYFLLGLSFDPEDGGDLFLRNVG
jgi:hypothetical protein